MKHAFLLLMAIFSLSNCFAQAVKKLPDPSVGGYASGDTVNKNAFTAQAGIALPVPRAHHMTQDPDQFHIIRYSVEVTRGDELIFEYPDVEGFLFPKHFLKNVRSECKAGDKIRFYNMTALVDNKTRQPLEIEYLLILK